jgi:hypothetical protein
MVFESLKRMLERRFKRSTRSSEQDQRARDVVSGVSVLRDGIERLNKFAKASNQAGLKDDFQKAVQSAQEFATCVASLNASGGPKKATEGVRSQYNETTSNLITLTLSANSVGINLQPEARSIFDTMTDLMALLGVPQG